MCAKGDSGVAEPAAKPAIKPARGLCVFYWVVFAAVLVACYGYVFEFVINSVSDVERNVSLTFFFGVMALIFLLCVDRPEWSRYFEKHNDKLNTVLVFSAASTAFCDYFKPELIMAMNTNTGIRNYVGVAVLIVMIAGLALMHMAREWLPRKLSDRILSRKQP
ncbi:hypothetical protein [Erwinia mallotivora]|uniref:hypothetical protein n=1 Tax=Erwinia mallotivora TaxID=69222 RepID=UPI0021C21F01|nr:hypothetical protein [Erwinia mallotivora]